MNFRDKYSMNSEYSPFSQQTNCWNSFGYYSHKKEEMIGYCHLILLYGLAKDNASIDRFVRYLSEKKRGRHYK